MPFSPLLKRRSALEQCVSTPVRSIAGVIRVMTQIEKLLPQEDGLWWFNWLYRQVTIAIQAECRKERWDAPIWVTHLDRDYHRINKILYEVELRCLQELTTGWIRLVSTRMDPYDRRLAITIVRWIRDLAWSHAEAYAKACAHDAHLGEVFVERLDRVTEIVARGTLVPTTWRREAALPWVRK